jgi:hypothetical protein
MRSRRVGPAAALMVAIAVAFAVVLVALVATRWGLDIIGPTLAEWMRERGWHDGFGGE